VNVGQSQLQKDEGIRLTLSQWKFYEQPFSGPPVRDVNMGSEER